MTEQEKMLQAKLYVDKMARGINPVDNTPAAEHDVINNLQVSRCLLFISDVLEKTINKSSGASRKKVAKKPFFVSWERRRYFRYGQEPIPISEIAKRIAELAEEDMAKLSYRAIRNWLISVGLLEQTPEPNGKTSTTPSIQGEKMGIRLEERMGQRGVFYVTLYSRAAQQFILDNLDAIVEHEAAQKALQGKRNPQ